MPTNEERQNIAYQLRYRATYGNLDHLYLEEFEDAIREAVSDEIMRLERWELLDRLADLIEPEPERKAKSKPFPIEKDTGYFDTTKCECGYLNDVSATYCGQCGGVIEVVE